MHLEIAQMLYPYLEYNLSRETISSVNGTTLVSYKKDIKNDKVILNIAVNYKRPQEMKKAYGSQKMIVF